ncbi:MAG: hypothetical protein ACYDAQ_18820 [Mycobacteriales bacterium]
MSGSSGRGLWLGAGLPTEAEMVSWIETVVNQGVRRPGYPADVWTERWLVETLESFGLEVRLERVTALGWTPGEARLEVWPAAEPEVRTRFDGFPVPYTQSSDGVSAPLRLVTGDVRGAIAVSALELMTLPQADLLPHATAAIDLAGTLAADRQLLPFGLEILEVVEPALAGGAVGFVGALGNYAWDTDSYYVPYDARPRALPGLWLRPSRAQCLLDLLAVHEALEATLVATGVTTNVTTHNVVATLPGPGESWVVVGSHHDAPWASAVEDGTGIALVLAQAKYWASVPVEQRPHNMCFVLTAGHMAGGIGTQTFVEDHPDLLAATVLELHLEHAAARAVPDGAGGLVATGEPEVRWWFTTPARSLEAAVTKALQEERLDRSIVLRPTVFTPDAPPTDGAAIYRAGVPITHCLAAPSYLFDAGDTMAMVHRPSLEPLSRASVRILGATAGWRPETLRAEAAAAQPGE